MSRGLLNGVTCGVSLKEGKPKAMCPLVDETTAVICAYDACFVRVTVAKNGKRVQLPK